MAEERPTLSEALGVADTIREFTLNTGDKYFIKPPSAEDIRKADLQYSKAYSDALVNGIFTASEMVDILKRRGIIGPEYEERANELTTLISNKISELNVATDRDEKQKLALEIADLREQIFQWNQRLNGPMANTCEQLADDARIEYLTFCMVYNADGSRVWDKFEDYLHEKNRNLQFKSRFEVMLYLQGLDSDFLEKTPEQIALRQIQEEVFEELDKKIKDAEGLVAVSEVEEDINKKKGRKTKKDDA